MKILLIVAYLTSLFLTTQAQTNDKNVQIKLESNTVLQDVGLNKVYDYSYYERKYKSANIVAGTGMAFAVGGALLTGIAYYVAGNESKNNEINKASIIYASGIVCLNIGIPVLIIGSVMKSNNKKAMDEIRRKNELSLRITNNGFGLVYSF